MDNNSCIQKHAVEWLEQVLEQDTGGKQLDS